MLQDFSFIFIAHPVIPVIVIGDVGKLCSDIGTSNLPQSDCLNFAKMEHLPIAIMTGGDKHYPPACFKVTNNMTIFWNADKTGMHNPEAMPICEKTGKYTIAY